MADSFMVVEVSDSTRFWTRGAADAANAFLNRNANIEAALIEDPTPPLPTPPPTNTVPPTIQTLTNLEVGATLINSSLGTWTGSPTYTRQWFGSGVAIPGATGTTYVLQASDAGNMITCMVTGTNAGGSAIATSNALGPIIPLP